MAKRRKAQFTARQLAVAAARIGHGSHATGIEVLDLRRISPVADYFVLMTGTSDRQMRSIADEIVRAGAEAGQKVWNVSGLQGPGWILLDFVDTVVHIFDDARRSYYALELIWGDAPRVRWQPRRQAQQPERPNEEP